MNITVCVFSGPLRELLWVVYSGAGLLHHAVSVPIVLQNGYIGTCARERFSVSVELKPGCIYR